MIRQRVAVLLALAVSSAAYGQGTDPAAFFPAHTLAYLELSDPTRAADEVRALLRGSVLQDPLRCFALFGHDRAALKEAALFSLFIGPEALGELADWQAAAVGLTGFTPRQYPEISGALLTGRGRMLSLAARGLVLSEKFSILKKVEGIEIFQVGDGERPDPDVFARARGKRLAVALARALAPEAARAARAPRWTALLQVPLPEALPPGAVPVPADPPLPAPAAPPPAIAPAGPPAAGPTEVKGPPEFGFFIALPPGAILFGTTPQAITDVVRRHKGKDQRNSLAQSATYRELAAGRHRPDLFAFLDGSTLARFADHTIEQKLSDRRNEVRQQNKARQEQEKTRAGKKEIADKLIEELAEAERKHRRDYADWHVFRTLVRPEAMRWFASSLTIHNSDLSWQLEAKYRPGESSPLLGLLANRPTSEDLLSGLPRDGFLFLTLPMSDGANTWLKALRLADACHAATGDTGPLPSVLVGELQKQLKVRLGPDVCGRLSGIGWGLRVGATSEDEPDVGTGVLAAEATNEAAALAIEALLPRLLAPGATDARPQTVTVLGQNITSLCGDADKAPGALPAFYARRGRTLVLGWGRRDVAQALRTPAGGPDLLDHPSALAALRRRLASASLLVSGRQALANVARVMSHKAEQSNYHIRQLSYLRELSAPMAVMSPTLLALERQRDGLSLELTQSDMRAASGTVVDMLLAWALDNGKD